MEEDKLVKTAECAAEETEVAEMSSDINGVVEDADVEIAGNGISAACPEIAPLAPFQRLYSLDNIRGLVIILMVFAGLMSSIDIVPAWLKHPYDIGFSVVDVGAPLFLFAISLTIKDAFNRRKAKFGRVSAYGNMLLRYVSIVGLGALAMAVEGAYMGDIPGWSVLHAIGFAGIITVFLIELPTSVRAVTGILIIVVYQILLDHFFLGQVLASRGMHSGFIGAFSWAGMLVLFSAIADLYKKKRWYLFPAAIALLVGFLISYFATGVPVSKVRVSSSFVFATMAICCAGFGVLDYLPFFRKPIPFLSWWGESPMLFYIADMIIIALTIVVLGGTEVYSKLPGWAVPIVLIVALAIMGILGFIAHKKHWKLKL